MRPITRHIVFVILALLGLAFIRPGYAETYLVDFDESQAEFLMLQAINTFRYEEGLSLLSLDENLSLCSKRHAIDMAGRDYFDHFTPEGLSPDDRARSLGVPNLVRENIGIIRTFGQDLDDVVNALMLGFLNSPNHRENLLNPDITHVGIGFYQDVDGINQRLTGDEDPNALYRGFGTVLVVQDFCRRNVTLLEPIPYSGYANPGEFVTLKMEFSEDVSEAFLRISPVDSPSDSYEVPLSTNGSAYRARFAIGKEGSFTIGIYTSSPSTDWYYRKLGRLELTINSQSL